MTTLREAAQQALEALENDVMQRTYAGGVRISNAAIALRAALAEPVQEPVAWVECDGELVWSNREAAIGRNLYTAPPQRKPPTKEEIMRAFYAAEKTPMSIRHGLSVVESARIVERAHGIGEQP